MNLVDVHAHLDMLDDIDDVLERAADAGVNHIISNGTNPESNRAVMQLATTYEVVEPALGIYPNDALELDDDAIREELAFIREQCPRAIGEIGLDYKEDVDEERMQDVFKRQIDVANALDIPIIVHSRKAEGDVIDIIQASGHDHVIMHCFGGRKHQVRRIRDYGWTFSIPAIVTKLHHFQMIVDMVPFDQLLTETDSPFLAPNRGEQNEPANVQYGIDAIAEEKDVAVEEAAERIYENYDRLFV
jgi:TatD DNase family protein